MREVPQTYDDSIFHTFDFNSTCRPPQWRTLITKLAVLIIMHNYDSLFFFRFYKKSYFSNNNYVKLKTQIIQQRIIIVTLLFNLKVFINCTKSFNKLFVLRCKFRSVTKVIITRTPRSVCSQFRSVL